MKVKQYVSDTASRINYFFKRGVLNINDRKVEADPRGEENKTQSCAADVPTIGDRYHLVYIFFLLQGVGILLPWNMFINADDYFTKYKFANHPNLAARYLPLVGILSQMTNLMFIFVNIAWPAKGALIVRTIVSQVVMIIVFLATCIFPSIDTSSWQYGFFIITMVSVVAINSAVGIFQSTVYGLSANFPQMYSNAIITGTNLSGIFGSVLFIICLASTNSYSMVASFYFSIAVITVAVCLICFLTIRFNKFYRYNTEKRSVTCSNEQKVTLRDSLAQAWHVIKLIPVDMYNIFFIFFVSLTIFPSMHANVQVLDADFPIPPKYFTPVTCFLFFNIFAFLGNLASVLFVFPSKRWLWIPITLRILFVPVFFFSNFFASTRTFPVWINNDYVPIVAEILMAFTSGYYSSLVIMFAPRSIPAEHSVVGGMLSSLFLCLGVTVGVYFSMLLVSGVTAWGPCLSAAQNNGTLLCQ